MIHLLLLGAVLIPEADLADLYRLHQFDWSSHSPTGREILRGTGGTIVLSPGMSVVIVNGEAHRLDAPVRIVDGRIRVPGGVVKEIRKIATRRRPEPPVHSDPFPKFSIVIDPGHGGRHRGGKGSRGLLEKDVNLAVSHRLRRILEAGGVDVTMTRTRDRDFAANVHEDLQHRVDIVERQQPDLFLSVHANSVNNPGPRGVEVWVPAKARGMRKRESRRLAGHLRRELVRVTGSPDRGTKDEKNLYVLRNTSCPAALVELEFLSNPEGARILRDPAWHEKLARALAAGLRRYVSSK